MIKAVVVDLDAPGHLALAEVEAPVPKPNEAVVHVSAVSLNRGEVKAAQAAPAGYRPGWDMSGIVEQAAADGSGPKSGTRVVGMVGEGAWSELVAVPAHLLAELPANVSFSQAATLPVAGLTALYALEKGGNLQGRRVLVTGATGGVGYFATQLASGMNGDVVAMIRQPKYEALIMAAGAAQVIISEDGAEAVAGGKYHLIVDGLGGKVFGNLIGMLATKGTAVSYGATLGAEITFDATTFRAAGGASVYGFRLFHELKPDTASDLVRLAQMIAEGKLSPHVEVVASWGAIGSIAQRFLDRAFVGKVVLSLE